MKRHLEKMAAILCLTGAPHCALAGKPIVAHIFKMPEYVELSAVTTAGHYVLAHHLIRSLTKLDKFGKIQGDIAQKWQLSRDRKTWTITLGDSLFSNGEKITAADVVASIDRQRRLKGGVHFAFSEISSVKQLGSNSLQVTLHSPRNDFIFALSKPEFGVLHKSDIHAPRAGGKFTVTSGAYTLVAKEGTAFRLKRNPHFKLETRNEEELVLENSDGDLSPAALKAGKISFFTGQQNLSLARHKELSESASYKSELPHIGFSFWVSINPLSPAFQDAASRAHLQKLVREFQSAEMKGHSWERAHQLYLPDGDGRPSQAQLEKTWKSIYARARAPKGKPKLRVIPLLTPRPLIQELLDYLKLSYEIELVPFANEDELMALLNGGNFDLKIQSNDFSSTDLSENLKTSFNEVRPYIFLDKKSKVRALMRKSLETTDKSVQSNYYKEIATTLLDDGAIAPLAYMRLWFYMKRDLDISPWSRTYPEISFWKVRAE